MSDALYGRGLYVFVGLATASDSPTLDGDASTWATKPLPGQRGFETDTGDLYRYNGADWQKIGTTTSDGSAAELVVVSDPANEMIAARKLAVPAAGTKQSIQLWNPAGSGVNLAFTYAAFGSDASMNVDMYLTTLTDTVEDTRKSNKDMSGSAPSAELYIGEDETGGILFSTIVTQPNIATEPRWELSGIIVPPGNGIRWKAGTADKRLIYALNWTETAV